MCPDYQSTNKNATLYNLSGLNLLKRTGLEGSKNFAEGLNISVGRSIKLYCYMRFVIFLDCDSVLS
jgi:hypothetical protein